MLLAHQRINVLNAFCCCCRTILNINLSDNHLLCICNILFKPFNEACIRSYSLRLHCLHEVYFVDEVHIGLTQEYVAYFNIWN